MMWANGKLLKLLGAIVSVLSGCWRLISPLPAGGVTTRKAAGVDMTLPTTRFWGNTARAGAGGHKPGGGNSH